MNGYPVEKHKQGVEAKQVITSDRGHKDHYKADGGRHKSHTQCLSMGNFWTWAVGTNPSFIRLCPIAGLSAEMKANH